MHVLRVSKANSGARNGHRYHGIICVRPLPGCGLTELIDNRTLAIRYHNGTVATLSRVDATEFSEVMALIDRYGKPPGQDQSLANHDQLPLLLPPSTGTWETQLTGAITQILNKLEGVALEQHGLNLSPLLISSLPARDPSLLIRATHQAAKDANVELLLDGFFDMVPGQIGAASAANGIGLCPTFTKLDVCHKEESQMPESLVLGIEYTRAALTVTLAPFQASRKGFGFNYRRHWDLGAGNATKSTLYWTGVREAIKDLPRHWYMRRITDIVLMGESALNEKFLNTVQDVMTDILPEGVHVRLADRVVDPEFAAARGAAELAKRAMEAPDGCIERWYCDWWRRKIG